MADHEPFDTGKGVIGGGGLSGNDVEAGPPDCEVEEDGGNSLAGLKVGGEKEGCLSRMMG